ncbi:MAG: hypothetical protein NZ805_15085 [Armatimonadetes bacterium]|nr:hypothetical protein [Armatimonadota bacterium]
MEQTSQAELKVVDLPVIKRLRWHAIVLGLILIAAFSAISGWAALYRNELLSAGYLPRVSIPVLIGFTVLNAIFKRFLPSLSFTKSELIFIFALFLSTAAISGEEFGIHFYLNLLGLVYYDSPQSQWFGLFTPHIPNYLVPSIHFRDPSILWAFEGMPEGAKLPLSSWLIPLLVWTPYLLFVYALVTCLCGLFAKQWEENERLLYPLTQVPTEISSDERGDLPKVFLSHPFWLGFFIAALPYSIRALHLYFPQIPDPQIQRDGGEIFPAGPLSAFNGVDLHFYPEMVGIAFLLSREAGFSLWLFPFIRRTEVALRTALGFDMYHSEFITYQTIAAYIVMAVAIFWTARFHIIRALKEATVRSQGTEESKFLFGFLLSLLLILLWAKFVAKASWFWTFILFLGFAIVSVVVARVVCETGIYIYSSPFRVYQVIYDAFGTDRIGARNIVMLTAMSWVQIRSTATLASGYISNAIKLGAAVGISRLSIAFWFLLGIFIALSACHLTFPIVIYAYSLAKLSWWAQGAPQKAANFVGQYLTTKRPFTVHHFAGLLFGALTCLALIKLRLTFVGFPLHPLGFIAWQGWPIDRYWMPILFGWAWKSIVLHYGGYHAFKSQKPFAYGLIAGGSTSLTFWIVLRLFYPTAESIIAD